MMEARMPKLTGFRVAVVATDGFEESELTEPVADLRNAGAQVTILSLEPGQIQGVRKTWRRPCRSRSTARSGRSAPTTSMRCICLAAL
jgi:protease I